MPEFEYIEVKVIRGEVTGISPVSSLEEIPKIPGRKMTVFNQLGIYGWELTGSPSQDRGQDSDILSFHFKRQVDS